MFCLLKGQPFCSSIGILVIASFVVPNLIAAPLYQNGRGQIPNAPSQRTDQTDQMRQQQQNEENLQRRMDDLRTLPERMEEFELERERLKYLLRENFRAHYRIVRNDADELKRLARELQSYAESESSPQLPVEMLARVAKIEKLAHDVRANMAGRRLPKPKSAAAAPKSTSLNPQQLLLARSRAVNDLASKLLNAVAGYLASDNEQAVSVQALKKNSGKSDFDPNSVQILTVSMRIEQLAHQIRKANQRPKV